MGIEVGWVKPTAVKTALPVTLERFEAEEVPDGVQFRWSTADEKDFDRFEVEQSAIPHAGFVKIGTLRGRGSSYSFLDAAGLSVTSYYSLKMIDTDGTFSYSRIVSITSVYPNPAAGLTIYLDSAWPIESYQIYNAAGRKVNVRMQGQSGKYQFTFADQALPGIYVIAWKAGGSLMSQRFILN